MSRRATAPLMLKMTSNGATYVGAVAMGIHA
jgi:hypothetical protein